MVLWIKKNKNKEILEQCIIQSHALNPVFIQYAVQFKIIILTVYYENILIKSTDSAHVFNYKCS